MHFSIPDTQENKDDNGSTYIAYNLHINGVFHCSVRYRQMHDLHQQICKDVGSSSIPLFPPKKILQLTSSQIEERRAGLEKYILQLSQNPKVLSSDVFNGWLIWAQNETYCRTTNSTIDDVPVDVFLMNGQKFTLRVASTTQTNDILIKLAKQLNIPSEMVSYFSLFLIKRDDRDIIIVKKLQDFESPYISQMCADTKLRIVLRKSTWDPGEDQLLMDDRVTLGLMYMQAVAEIQRGWILCSNDVLSQLTSLQAKGAKREYMEVVMRLKYYGYMQFQNCVSDFPEPNTPVLIAAGNKELNFRVEGDNGSFKEGNFKVTRIRCWRISTLAQQDDTDFSSNALSSCSSSWPSNLNSGLTRTFNGLRDSKPPTLELSFEYLMNKDEMRWIKVVSSQAVLMSLCLQGMVQSLLQWKPPAHNRKTSFSYMKRNGSSVKVIINHTGEPLVQNSATSPIGELSWRRLSERLSDFTCIDGSRGQANQHMENRAFNVLGDDNL